MIIERIAILVAPERLEDLRRAFSSRLGPTSVEPGCISCDLYLDAQNPNRFCLESRWKTNQELVRHIRSEEYKHLLILLETAKEAPVIEFHDVVKTKGLEFVERLRQDIGVP